MAEAGSWIIRGTIAASGAGLFAFAVIRARRASAAAQRPTVPGKVISSVIEEQRSTGRGRHYRCRVTYTYTIDDTEHTSHRAFYGDDLWSPKPAEVNEVHQRYPEGATVTVYYDPNDPGDAVLETVVSRRVVAVAFTGLILFMTAWFLPF